MIELGGNITLVGFKDKVDTGSIMVLKKIIGNYVRRFTEASCGFEGITITLKTIHEIEDSKKFDVQIKAIQSSKPVNAETTDKNIFFAVDSGLKKIEKIIIK